MKFFLLRRLSGFSTCFGVHSLYLHLSFIASISMLDCWLLWRYLILNMMSTKEEYQLDGCMQENFSVAWRPRYRSALLVHVLAIMWTWTFQLESYIKCGSITGRLNQRRDWNSCWVKITIYSEVLYGSLLHICWIKYYWVDATMLVNFICNIIKCIAFFMSTWVLPSLFEIGALWFISNFLRKSVSKANHI